jgi:hypothetical protein
MARGDSERIVLERDPSAKEELYSAVIKDGLTLKSWFLQQASRYLTQRSRKSFSEVSMAAETQPYYSTGKRRQEATSASRKPANRKTE